MRQIILDAEAAQVSAELQRRGIPPRARVHVLVELSNEHLPMAKLAETGGAFDWLDDEPDLYSASDVLRAG